MPQIGHTSLHVDGGVPVHTLDWRLGRSAYRAAQSGRPHPRRRSATSTNRMPLIASPTACVDAAAISMIGLRLYEVHQQVAAHCVAHRLRECSCI